MSIEKARELFKRMLEWGPCIIGVTHSGMSYAAKLVLMREYLHYSETPNARLFIFDPSEYAMTKNAEKEGKRE